MTSKLEFIWRKSPLDQNIVEGFQGEKIVET